MLPTKAIPSLILGITNAKAIAKANHNKQAMIRRLSRLFSISTDRKRRTFTHSPITADLRIKFVVKKKLSQIRQKEIIYLPTK